MSLQQWGKLIMSIGVLLIITGAVVWLIGRLGLRRLPGDIVIRHGNFTFYFPIVTCILISIILSLVFYIIGNLGK